jgi:hypothetical protein
MAKEQRAGKSGPLGVNSCGFLAASQRLCCGSHHTWVHDVLLKNQTGCIDLGE